MTEEINQTIIKMVTDLRSSVQPNLNNFQFNSTPLKRPLSSISNEESQSSLEADPTPLKKLKQSAKLDMSYAASPRETRRLRTDLVEARNTIFNLEKRIQHMHGVQKEMRLMFDNESKGLQKQREYDKKSIEELETHVQSIRQREHDLKQQLAELKNKYSTMKVQKDEEIEELDKSISEIKEELRICNDEDNSEIVTLTKKVHDMQSLMEAAEEDVEAHKKLVMELEKQLSEKNGIERKMEIKDQALQSAKMRIKELEYAKENFLEFQELAKTQAHKLVHYIELVKENERLREDTNKLKEEVRNKLLMEEEVHNLKSRLVNYKENEKKLSHLQVQQVQLEMYLDEWRAVARGVCETTGSDSSLPHLLRGAVERLQQQEIHLTSAKVELESQLTAATYDAKVTKVELEKHQKLVEELKKTAEQKQNLIYRMQKRLMLVSRERDSYRLQLDSYEKDLTMTINLSPSAPNSHQVQAQKERIDQLEKIVANYRELNAKLETDIQNCTSDAAPTKQEKISRLKEEIQQLKMENEMLRNRKDQLEIQIEDQLVGNDTLKGGQVYHMSINPLQECLTQREQMLNKLEQENEKLKRKIKNMEEGLESSKLSESMMCPQDVLTLKEQVKSQESQNQRLKDYFKSSMQEFRNVIYMLLGYKIDRTSNSLYKLTSMYAEREEDQICFQLNDEGALHLLENEYSLTLEDMVNLHLRHQKSIPVFLSAITMDLFNNRTMTTTTFEID